jgi:hypothetical protein
MDKWGHEIGLPGWMTDPHALSDGIVPGIVAAIEGQTRALVAAIKGQAPPPAGTAMPTHPTSHLASQSMPMPGQISR